MGSIYYEIRLHRKYVVFLFILYFQGTMYQGVYRHQTLKFNALRSFQYNFYSNLRLTFGQVITFLFRHCR